MSWMDKIKESMDDGIDRLGNSLDERAAKAEIEREKARKLEEQFKPDAGNIYVQIDTANRLWKLGNVKSMGILRKDSPIYDFEDLVSYDLIQDGDAVISGGFGVGRAITGVLLTGGIGALLGFTKKKKTTNYINNLKIRITTSTTKKPTQYIVLIDSKTKQNSIFYRKAMEKAQEIIGFLDTITKELEK